MNDNHIMRDNTGVFSVTIEKEFEKKTKAIAARVRRELSNKKWSIEQFAELMGESIPVVYEWLSGANNLTMRSIIKMEIVLGIDLTYCEILSEEETIFLDANTEKQIEQAIKVYKKKHNMYLLKEQRWLSRYLLLLEYTRKNGNADFPTSCKNQQSMSSWIGKQRKRLLDKTIDPDREELLKLVGLSRRLREIFDWDEMHAKLIAFKFEHGHVNITPDNVELPLYDWLRHQRERYHKGKLNADKLERLKKIGIRMEHKNRWEDKFAELVKFKKEHGHLNVSKTLGSNHPLSRWLYNQRSRQCTMKKERIRKLTKIGFAWKTD